MAKAPAKKAPAKKAPATKAPARKAAAGKTAPARASAGKAVAKKTVKTAVVRKTVAKAAPVKAAKAPAKRATKKTVTSAKANSAAVLTLRHIAETISEVHELTKRQANELIGQVVEIITKSLKKGDKVRLSGLGILQVKKRPARMARNPQTGEPVKVKASKKVAFRAAKELKETI